MEQKEKPDETVDQPLGVPPSEFHPHRPPAPFKKKGNVKLAIIVAILVIVIDVCIYFFLIKPDDSHLLKAIEPLKPAESTPAQQHSTFSTFEGNNFSFIYPNDAIVVKDGNKYCVTYKEWYNNKARSKDDCYGGQYVQIFSKKPSISLKDAIEEQILKNYDKKTCFVTEHTKHNNQGSKHYAAINFLVVNNDKHDPKSLENAKKCPKAYTETDGDVYFMEDTNTPDTFAFFYIGQFTIPGVDKGKAWQDTFNFNRKKITNTKYNFSLTAPAAMQYTFKENVNAKNQTGIKSLDIASFYEGEPAEAGGYTGPNFTIKIYPEKGNEHWLTDKAPSDTETTVVIAGETVKKLSGVAGIRIGPLKHNEYMYTFETTNEHEKTIEQILSTLAFTK